MTIKTETVLLTLTLALVLIAIANIYMLGTVKQTLSTKMEQASIAAIPAKISITTILADSCIDCFKPEPVVQSISSLADTNVTSQRNIQSSEANDLIARYKITKLPTIIVTGEVEQKSSVLSALTKLGATKADDGYIISALAPPYYDIASQKVIGYLELTYLLDSSCTSCQNITSFSMQLKQSGIPIKKEDRVERTSSQGMALISKYNLSGVPTIILRGDVGAYAILAQAWPQIGSVEKDGAYVLRTLSAPYYSIQKQRIVGDIALTALIDKTCTTCYDPLVFHKPILAGLGIKPKTEKTVDIGSAEGKTLISKYGLTAVPVIILSGDTFAYDAVLKSIWPSVGFKADDGAYIFTKAELAQQPYKNLATGEIVTPAPAANAEQ